MYRALHQAILAGLIQACHDCSEGGLAVAVAEMALAGDLGVEINLADVARTDNLEREEEIAFSESLGRLIVEVNQADVAAFGAAMAGHPLAQIGHVRDDNLVVFTGLSNQSVVETDLKAIEKAWRGHLGGT